MTGSDIQRLFVAAAVAAAALFSTHACAPRGGAARTYPEPDTTLAGVVDELEYECEEELQRLDALIERRGTDLSVPAHVLHEARALRRTAGELFMSGEFRLALELVDEAFALLGDGR